MNPTDKRGALFASLGANAAIVRIMTALNASPFAPPSRWRSCVVILRDEGDSAESRASLAGALRASDLETLAHECLARRVDPGQVLIWIEVDRENVGATSFVLVDMRLELARLAS